MVTKDDVVAALKTVQDPELQLDIWFLGLVYDIRIQEDKIAIDMTFTSPMCPLGPMMVSDVKQKVGALGIGEDNVEVKIVFTPPWTPSDDVKDLLGLT